MITIVSTKLNGWSKTMTTQMIIRIDDNFKNKISQLAKKEGKNLSELVRELLTKYTQDNGMASHIDNLWDNISNQFQSTGVLVSDIDAAIKVVRSYNG